MKTIKKILKITGVVLSLLIAFVLFLHIYLDRKIRQTNVDLITKDGMLNYRMVMPLEIQDSSYYFLWDTGAGSSFIDYALLDSLDLVNNNAKSITGPFFSVDKIIEETFRIQRIRCKLGDFSIPIRFLIDDKNFLNSLGPGEHSQIRGIIGQNVISKFYWLFDLDKSTATISKDPIFIEGNDSILKMPFIILKEENVPFVNLKLDIWDSSEFRFDSGYWISRNYSIGSLDYCLYPSFIISDSLAKLPISPSYSITTTIHSEQNQSEERVNIFDSTFVNGFPLEYISIANRSTSYRDVNYLTSSFIYQFEKMYYNSRDKEISLIGYRGNTYPTGDEEKLIRYLRENYAIPEN